MQLVINEKEIELYFGIDFIEFLDKKYSLKREGVEFAMGVSNAIVYLQQANPRILIDIIQAGTINSNNKVGVSEIKRFVESQEDLEWMFSDFLGQLETAPMTKTAFARMRKAQAEQAQAEQAQAEQA